MQPSPVLVDVVAIVGFVVLAALGKISPELASGTVLAVLAGRMRPVVGGGNRGGSAGSRVDGGAAPESKDDPTIHASSVDCCEPVPSGMMTLINAPRAVLAALRQ